MNLVEMYSIRRMLDALVIVPEALTFLLTTFFPGKMVHDVTAVDIDVVKGGRPMAPFVNPLGKGTRMDSKGYNTKTFSPPYIKPYRSITPRDLMNRNPGEVIYQNSLSSEDRLSALIGKHLSDMRQYIIRREEWMAAQAMISGKVIVQGEGVNAEVDFGRDPALSIVLAGTDKWTDPASKPIDDLIDWKQLVARLSGWMPNTAVVGTDVEKAMLSNPQILALLHNRRVEIGQIKPQDLPKGVSYIGSLKDVDFYGYSEFYDDDTTGETTPLIPADRMILGHNQTRAVRHYGAIEDLDAMKKPIMGVADYFPKLWAEENPSLYNVMLQSSPLPVPHEIDAFASIKIL